MKEEMLPRSFKKQHNLNSRTAKKILNDNLACDKFTHKKDYLQQAYDELERIDTIKLNKKTKVKTVSINENVNETNEKTETSTTKKKKTKTENDDGDDDPEQRRIKRATIHKSISAGALELTSRRKNIEVEGSWELPSSIYAFITHGKLVNSFILDSNDDKPHLILNLINKEGKMHKMTSDDNQLVAPFVRLLEYLFSIYINNINMLDNIHDTSDAIVLSLLQIKKIWGIDSIRTYEDSSIDCICDDDKQNKYPIFLQDVYEIQKRACDFQIMGRIENDLYSVLNIISYSFEKQTIKISSPYLFEILKRYIEEKSKKNTTTYTCYLIKSNSFIAKNKCSLAIVKSGICKLLQNGPGQKSESLHTKKNLKEAIRDLEKTVITTSKNIIDAETTGIVHNDYEDDDDNNDNNKVILHKSLFDIYKEDITLESSLNKYEYNCDKTKAIKRALSSIDNIIEDFTYIKEKYEDFEYYIYDRICNKKIDSSNAIFDNLKDYVLVIKYLSRKK